MTLMKIFPLIIIAEFGKTNKFLDTDRLRYFINFLYMLEKFLSPEIISYRTVF